MKRHYVFCAVLALAVASCRGGGRQPGERARRATALGDALAPEFFAKALRRLGGAHFHGTTRFAVGPAGQPPTEVNTTTDVWIDRAGNFRLREDNDQDGGRQVVLYGRELAVALRYGKMIRRVAEEPEPSRLLEEALGGPWAAFEIGAPGGRVSEGGSELYAGAKANVFTLAPGEGVVASRGAAGDRSPRGARPAVGLRAWRTTGSVEAISGRVAVDDATGAVVKSDLSVRFSAKGEGGPVAGAVDVHTVLSEIANTPAIARPEAEELALRQRIVPEQRELLRGLPQVRAIPKPPAGGPARAPRPPVPRPAGASPPPPGQKGKAPAP